MNDLEKYFRQNNDRLIQKWMHYFDIYESHFSKYRGKEVHILEIGVSQGGSLQMWKNYFGPKAKIYGIDINPKCKDLEEENIKIFIGSQSDRDFLRKVKSELPPLDIFIDDGGHSMKQQIVSFEELFDHVKSDGVYLCEDLHTSYWLEYGGGHKRKGTFIEYSKNFIDYIHGYHSEQKSLGVNNLTKAIKSAHYYDSILVLEKGIIVKPHDERSGTPSFELDQPSEVQKKKYKIKYTFYRSLNEILRFFRLPSVYWK
ncbi:MAG: class I SAM-dependent methyltransferase [Saprospiraceae bacterium]|nr:class I SAM-dependent methyltransferase [Saprospiraceae bacterium]